MLHIILIGAMLSDSRPEPDRIEAEAAEPQRYTREHWRSFIGARSFWRSTSRQKSRAAQQA
jgi:hypothetical protein